jgi:hypothetical protein
MFFTQLRFTWLLAKAATAQSHLDGKNSCHLAAHPVVMAAAAAM